MTLRIYILYLLGVVNILGLILPLAKLSRAENYQANCPTPGLERFLLHRVSHGENLETIAQIYNIKSETIVAMNPELQNTKLTIGSNILIPPYNGIVIEVSQGQTWRELGTQYQVRPDVLFELNGCQSPDNLAFIPVVNGKRYTPDIAKSSSQTDTDLTNPAIQAGNFPLQNPAKIALPYGWQMNPMDKEVFFHSGIDFFADKGSNVQAIAPGVVVLAQEKGSYGNLIIINHSERLQSRYAHLENINVKKGQQVKTGELLGTVGTTGKPNFPQPHLHFEVRARSSLGWIAKDPQTYLQK